MLYEIYDSEMNILDADKSVEADSPRKALEKYLGHGLFQRMTGKNTTINQCFKLTPYQVKDGIKYGIHKKRAVWFQLLSSPLL